MVNTLKMEFGVRRQRRCSDCKTSFYTMETLYSKPVTEKTEPASEPVPDKRGLYTKKDALEIKRKQVETRRKNADRVPSYFIEDDYE